MPKPAAGDEEPPTSSQAPVLYLLAVGLLGAFALVGLVGAIVLIGLGKTLPDGYYTPIGVAVGLLGGLLARGK
jgi:hypothetical protein